MIESFLSLNISNKNGTIRMVVHPSICTLLRKRRKIQNKWDFLLKI